MSDRAGPSGARTAAQALTSTANQRHGPLGAATRSSTIARASVIVPQRAHPSCAASFASLCAGGTASMLKRRLLSVANSNMSGPRGAVPGA